MKKTFLAALASLMLAGAISAASGLTTDHFASSAISMASDGTSPASLSAVPVDESGGHLAHSK